MSVHGFEFAFDVGALVENTMAFDQFHDSSVFRDMYTHRGISSTLFTRLR